MKFPKPSLTHLPILLVLVTLAVAGLTGQLNSSVSQSHSPHVSHQAATTTTQPPKAGTTFVLGSSTATTNDASTNNSISQTSGAPARVNQLAPGQVTPPAGQPTTQNDILSPMSSSPTQQQSMTNPCSICPTNTACVGNACQPVDSPPASGGCGVCGTTNPNYPHMHTMCPMYCSPIDEIY